MNNVVLTVLWSHTQLPVPLMIAGKIFFFEQEVNEIIIVTATIPRSMFVFRA